MKKILDKCGIVYDLIHNPFFKNYYFPEKASHFTKIFTSLDVIEDTQNAINEFLNIPESSIFNRSTFYIYGVLQSMYCQQDGVMHLYQSIIERDKNKKSNIYKLFEEYNTDKQIRIIRDDIAGHPADRNRGKEFYFIAKETNSKSKFTYAGYAPGLKTVDVNMFELIKEQETFTLHILADIANDIETKITKHKLRFMDKKLSEYNNIFDSLKRMIVKGIHDSNFGVDTSSFLKNLEMLKTELNNRYYNNIPESLNYIFSKIDYIIEKLNYWAKNNEISSNIEVDIFMDSFNIQLTELNDILIEIDKEFENY